MTMEPLSPIYPQNEDIYRPSNQEPNAQPPKPERSAPAMYPSFPSPSHQEASTSSDPSVANDYTSTSDWQHSSYAQLYSPTREEIEKHPIRQRLSQVRDDIVSALGSGSAPTEGFQKKTALLFDNSSRQAAEGSERLFDAMAEVPNVKEGDKVAWNWSGGAPGGTAAKVSEDEVTMETKRGNEVKKQGDSENPAVYIERSGHDVVKKASELEVEKEGPKHKGGESEYRSSSESKKEDDKKEQNGEPQTGDKRSAEETSEEKKDEEKGDAKKQKTDKPKENGDHPKKKGRPAKKDANGQSAPKKDTKKRAPKKAATESGEPRRSGRVASKTD